MIKVIVFVSSLLLRIQMDQILFPNIIVIIFIIATILFIVFGIALIVTEIVIL